MKNPFNSSTHPNVYKGHQYAEAVVAGLIPNCIYVVGACKRYFKDLENGKFPFNADRAEKYLRLVQRFEHVIGNWTEKFIVYEPWQCFAFMNIIGFENTETGFRRFRTAHLEFPRGQGKSAMASQAALFFLALDEPKGNIVSCFATKADQARIVLDSARAMAKKAISYRQNTGVKVLAHSIIHDKSFSKIRYMSADSKSLDGLNDILAVMDELHAMDRGLYDVVTSGMSKRQDSLVLCITTAGFSTDSVGYSQSTYAKKIALGETEDDTFFALVYTVDKGDDIFSELTWKKANPNWGVSVDPVTFAVKAKKTVETPADIPNFKVKHLNMWLSEANAYFNLEKWDLCADPTLKLEDFAGEKCVVGVDLASKIDLTSLGIIFKRGDIYYLFDKSYIPEVTVQEVRNTLYDNCIAQGHLIATKGEAINYGYIKEELLDLNRVHKISEVPYDPWSATSFAQELSQESIEMVEFRFNTANLSEPTKNMDALIRQGKIKHNGSPLLRWAFGNIVCKMDAAENVFPRKTHERLKIDPAIALIMSLAVWLQKDQSESVYETRGILVL